MTLSEFKAWFEGYTEGLDGAPTDKQFKRIKAKVAEISGTPITQTVFVDRYRDYYRQYYGTPAVWGGVLGNVSYASGTNGLGKSAQMGAGQNALGAEWDSHSAMYALGKSEANVS